MVSLPQPEYKKFDQRKYSGYNFYYCDKEHPFIVFTTCFCPLCEKIDEAMELNADNAELEDVIDEITENYQKLYMAAAKFAPEILI